MKYSVMELAEVAREVTQARLKKKWRWLDLSRYQGRHSYNGYRAISTITTRVLEAAVGRAGGAHRKVTPFRMAVLSFGAALVLTHGGL